MTINPRSIEAYNLLHEGTLAFARAERQGIRVDLQYIHEKRTNLQKKMNYIESKFKSTKFYKHWQHTSKSGKPNINSDSQLSHFLYHIKKLEPPKRTQSGQGSIDEESLKQLNIPELNLLLKKKKIKGIIDKLDGFERETVNGYMHPVFNLNTVTTYRSSSDSPNFQNIHKRDKEASQICRGALFPRPGHQLLSADFSGIEVRIAACYHRDTNMIKYISDPESDMHGDMAKQIFMIDNFDKSISSHNILRQAAKNGFVFPQFYGDYYKNNAINICNEWIGLPKTRWKTQQGIELSDGLFISDHLISKGIKEFGKEEKLNGKWKTTGFLKHLKEIELDFWNNRFADYQRWKENWWKVYQKYGYIDMKTGFRCSGVMKKNDCINYPIQGTAFHCLLWPFIQLDRIFKSENWDSKLIGQIHDDIIIDVHPDELLKVAKTVKRVTCEELPNHWDWINVPLDIEMELCPVDKSWADKEVFCI